MVHDGYGVHAADMNYPFLILAVTGRFIWNIMRKKNEHH